MRGEPQIQRLSPTGRALRLAVAFVVIGLLLAGTFFGDDDHFPFGPFRMYSTSNELNAPVRDTRIRAINAEGEEFPLGVGSTGLRRAEFEGQVHRFEENPELLSYVAEAYHRRHPDAPPLVQISIVVVWHEVRDGLATGNRTEEVIVTWHAEEDIP